MWIYSALKARNWGWKTGALFPSPPPTPPSLPPPLVYDAQALAVKKLWVLPLALLDFCSVMYVWPCWHPTSTKKKEHDFGVWQSCCQLASKKVELEGLGLNPIYFICNNTLTTEQLGHATSKITYVSTA